MKIKTEHRELIASAVKPLDTPMARQMYTSRSFPRANKVKDLNKRYRWDLLYASKVNVSAIYEYANDDHIDTVLRNLIKPL
jgi:hypothetical protein